MADSPTITDLLNINVETGENIPNCSSLYHFLINDYNLNPEIGSYSADLYYKYVKIYNNPEFKKIVMDLDIFDNTDVDVMMKR